MTSSQGVPLGEQLLRSDSEELRANATWADVATGRSPLPRDIGPHLFTDPYQLQGPWAAPADHEQNAEQQNFTTSCILRSLACGAILDAIGLGMLYFGITELVRRDPTGLFVLGWYFFSCGGYLFFSLSYSSSGGPHGDPNYGSSEVDWLGIGAFLESLENKGNDHIASEPNDHNETANLLISLRQKAPSVAFKGTVGHSDVDSFEVTHSDVWYFKYARWRDVSGRIADLEKYSIVALQVVLVIEAADQETAQALESSKENIRKHIGMYDPVRRHPGTDISTFSFLIAAVSTRKGGLTFKVRGTRAILSRRLGKKTPVWMNIYIYWLCWMLSLGTLYQILFLMRTKRMVYYIRKEVSVKESP